MNAKTNPTEETVHILIVDDSPTQLENLKYILEQHSYSVTAANSGKQALAHIGKKIPTLVITDIVMPEMSGYELCRKIKEEEKTRDIPVILLTSLSSTEDVLEGLACGADNFISKPYSEQYLLSNIANILINAKLRKNEYVRLGMEIQFEGKKRFITAGQQQMLSMLISTYEAAVNRNKELIEAQQDLEITNEHLEEMVEKRTAMLNVEITEHKRAEEALRSERSMLARTEGIAHIGSWEWNIATDTVNWSDELFRIFQRDQREGAPSFAEHPAFYNPDDMARLRQAVETAVADGTPYELELRAIRKDGETRICVARGVAEMKPDGQAIRLFGSLQDITERKKAEERYKNLFDNAQEGIFQTNAAGRFLTANRALATILDYDSPEELMTTVTDIATQIYVNPEDRQVILQMIEEQGSIKGFETQSYRKNGSIIWVSVNQQAVRDAGGHLLYYEGFIEDITTKKENMERMRKALRATIQAIAVTVETRDPYTAGHQRRVVDLARTIATEMNFSADQIEGICMAATIHDLGKISVPAEILSKPTKLTNIEFDFIKAHVQSGHDILKDIDFPWPIARIVLEHHERMNGSGYPNGLTGDSLLPESKILAVADTVESMASHRPSRPALGLNKALTEIENNKEVVYDEAAVDACLRLFREKGYQLT